jgi:uncharacterized protein YcbK (DUF882 family)
MGIKLSDHFNSNEFACHCGCGDSAVSDKLVNVLEIIRTAVGRPLSVVSGKRCEKHNRAVGGVKNSQHKLGMAADIKVSGLTPRQVHDAIEKLHHEGVAHIGGLGLYKTFVHVDVRGGVARWNG